MLGWFRLFLFLLRQIVLTLYADEIYVHSSNIEINLRHQSHLDHLIYLSQGEMLKPVLRQPRFWGQLQQTSEGRSAVVLLSLHLGGNGKPILGCKGLDHLREAKPGWGWPGSRGAAPAPAPAKSSLCPPRFVLHHPHPIDFSSASCIWQNGSLALWLEELLSIIIRSNTKYQPGI